MAAKPRPSDPIEKRLPFACSHCYRRFVSAHALKMHFDAKHRPLMFTDAPPGETR